MCIKMIFCCKHRTLTVGFSSGLEFLIYLGTCQKLEGGRGGGDFKISDGNKLSPPPPPPPLGKGLKCPDPPLASVLKSEFSYGGTRKIFQNFQKSKLILKLTYDEHASVSSVGQTGQKKVFGLMG